jgi:hypothetical protein
MNLLVVSEKHGLLILGVSHELWVYQFDPVAFAILSPKATRIQLDNSEVSLKCLIAIVRDQQHEAHLMRRAGVPRDC